MKYTPHFSIAKTFGGIPYEFAGYEHSKIVLLPVPYDGTTSYQPGARNGPRAILDASQHLELYDAEFGQNFSEIGICTLDELEPVNSSEKMNERVFEAAHQLFQDEKVLIMIGGEHSLSSAAVRAALTKFPELTVLHVDAHADLREIRGEDRYDHGCVARRIHEMAPIVEVGIRSHSEEEASYISERHIPVFYDKDLHGDHKWIGDVLALLGEHIYLTIDVDCMDPAIMPSTGTPEPGGFSWRELNSFLGRIISSKIVVGMDVMELSPQAGNHAPDFTAAKLIYKMIGLSHKSSHRKV